MYLKVLQRPLSRYRCVPDRVRRVCGARGMIEVYNVTVHVATEEMSLAGFMVALKPLPPDDLMQDTGGAQRRRQGILPPMHLCY